ncbi:MAG: hypothetical protein M0Q92_11805 [Methanoregula sp.]|jgi:hypothetical protein|nr:hypothetical protein [Methanoregula sp.]
MSATATATDRTVYKKLFFEHNGVIHDLKELIGPAGAKLVDILRKIDPSAKVDGSDPLYTRFYRRIKYLVKKGLFDLVKRERVDWQKTNDQRMQEIENSVQDIFAKATQQPTPPIVSSGTTPTEAKDPISTVKVMETAFTVVPTGQLFYLFSQVQNSNHAKKSAKLLTLGWIDPIYRIPAKCSTERVSAIKTMMDIQGRALFQRDCTCPKCSGTGHMQPGKGFALCGCGCTWRPPINPELRGSLKDVQLTFGDWEGRIQNQELFFDRGPGTQLVKMPCRTRFTDKGRKVHNIKTYDRAWNRANLLYRRGVFVTLTTDPSLHKSLWHANRHLSRAFNRYMSLLVSRKKRHVEKRYDIDQEQKGEDVKRLKYISAYEFQENGLIHLHAVFFGIRYLASIDQISEDWQMCGQGRIVHAYGIRKEDDIWHWNKESPKDADGKSPVDYLRKYLEKALYVNESFGMYWAVNKRFCSMSRIFQTKECQGCRAVWGSALRVCPDCGAPLRRMSQGFRFLGALEKGNSPTAEMMQRHRWPIAERSDSGCSIMDDSGNLTPGAMA